MSSSTLYIQDYMPQNTCFGCGVLNPEGLHIKSYWENDACVCDISRLDAKYQGFKGLLNGGILATLIDCHAMGTALSHAYHLENRPYGSLPLYMYATGSLQIRYLKPTPIDAPLRLLNRVQLVKDRKTVVISQIWAGAIQTAEAEVIAIRVFDSRHNHGQNPFAS
ncbi:MAG: PaaI family thioesterase [Microscillaceae bacterium]|nr:PaaI family thioesterase [Microscillaceae bacterium]